jgi:putative membrane protein
MQGMHLTSEEAVEVERRVAALEARTGIQVVAAVVARSDHYPEIPWTAFALGASLGALAAALAGLLRAPWVAAAAEWLHGVAILAAGATCALAAVLAPGFARLFLRDTRADGEVLQHAEGMFLEREVFRTPSRTGLLVLASLFERRVVVVPDVGFRERIGPEEWRPVVDRMAPALAAGRTAAAFGDGLAALEELLERKGFSAGGAGRAHSLPDRPVEERGA